MLDELMKKAFAVTQDHWDERGRPTPAEVDARDRFRQDLLDFRERTDARMASSEFGVGDGLVRLSHSMVTDAGLAVRELGSGDEVEQLAEVDRAWNARAEDSGELRYGVTA